MAAIHKELKREKQKNIVTSALVTVLILVFLLIFILNAWNDAVDSGSADEFVYLDMVGEYSLDEETWVAFDSLEDLPDELEHVHIIGHFTDDLPNDAKLIIPIYNCRMTCSINGEEFLNFGEEGTYRFSHGPGYTLWYKQANRIEYDGITQADEIEICADNIYYKIRPTLLKTYLCQMRFGDMNSYFRTFRDNAWELVASLLMIGCGILVGGFAVVMFLRNKRQFFASLSFALFTLFSGLYCLVQSAFPFLPLIAYRPIICNYLDRFPQYFMIVTFDLYVLFNLPGRRTRLFMYASSWTTMAITFIALLHQISGVRDLFEMQYMIMVPGLVTIVGAMICLILDGFHYKDRHCFLLLAILSPFLVAILMTSIWSKNSTVWMRGAIFLMVFLHVFEMFRFYRIQRERENARKDVERELVEARVAVMQSQIQPHFLYNTLSTIQILIDKDPILAGDVVTRFSRYLRANMASLDRKECIPFAEELEHLKNYLYIEQLRFGDKLKVDYQIETEDFLCPALSLQPVVENAVKHGLGAKEEGGTVTIQTRETETAFEILVEDDGVGFDVAKVSGGGELHIGMKNTRYRLMEMCNGSMEIDSKPEEGTRVTLRIPKGETK